jgi:LysM repeat protein
MSRKRRRPRPGAAASSRFAHYAAPIAFLAGVTIAVLLVHSALDHRGTSTTTSAPTTTATAPTTAAAPRSRGQKKFYVVQTGDTFGTIASKAGISLGRLQSLNPRVSSNALQVGQKLRVK